MILSSFLGLTRGLAARKQGFKRLLILLLINLVVFGGVTYQLANRQERLSSEEARLTFQVEQAREELERVARDEERTTRNARVVSGFWNEVVPERSPGLTEAWDEIDRIAGETNIARGRTGYDREILDVGLERIQASMPLEGDYFDLVRFLNRLERSERFFLVDEVRISQRQAGDAQIRLDCSVTFFLKPVSATAPQVARR